MADRSKEGAPTYQEQQLKRKEIDQALKDLSPDDKDQVLSKFSRRTFLVRSGKLGAGVVVGAAGLAGLGAYNVGVQNGVPAGAKEERARLFLRGDLTPELRAKLATAEHSVVEIQGWTAASLREAGWEDVPDFPFPVPEGQPNPDNTPSIRNWIAFGPGGIYLPREEDDTVGDLTSDMNTANSAAGRIDVSLAYKPADNSEFLEADLASLLRPGGQTIFQAGHVVTTHQVTIDGVTNGIAIGRTEPTAPISYITFDAAKEAPLPVGVSAGGFVGAK